MKSVDDSEARSEEEVKQPIGGLNEAMQQSGSKRGDIEAARSDMSGRGSVGGEPSPAYPSEGSTREAITPRKGDRELSRGQTGNIVDKLVVIFAQRFAPGKLITAQPAAIREMLGLEDDDQVIWLIRQAIRREVFEAEIITPVGSNTVMFKRAGLTLLGWNRYDELMRSGAGSRNAFMAMEFEDEELLKVFREHMKPAVAATGFVLRAMNEGHQTAGLIDDRMRVEIRTSRFVICDLTHSNRGAYWEAGFAEGVGRKVFFTCKRQVLEDRSELVRPHFDISHHLILDWCSTNLFDFRDRLKSAIRATLPEEAVLEDSEEFNISISRDDGRS